MTALASVRQLAHYMTNGARVMRHSIGLQLQGMDKSEADDFFALRNEFGVHGYMTANEAEACIARALGL